MKNNLFKKSMSVFLTALMLLSCWVFVPEVHEHLEAEAALAYGAPAATEADSKTGYVKFHPKDDVDYVNMYYPSDIYIDVSEDLTSAGYKVYLDGHYGDGDNYRTLVYSTAWGGSYDRDNGVLKDKTMLNVFNNYTYSASGTNVYNAKENYSVDGTNWVINFQGASTNFSATVNLEGGTPKVAAGEYHFDADNSKSGTVSHARVCDMDKKDWLSRWGKNVSTTYIGNSNYTGDINIYIHVYDKAPLQTAVTNANTYLAKTAQYDRVSLANLQSKVNEANTILKTRNVTQAQVTAAKDAITTAINGLVTRTYEVTYDNMFSLSDWWNSGSYANATADLNAGTVTIKNTATGEVTTSVSGGSSNANTRNTNYYAMPVVGGKEYTFKYTVSGTDTQMFAFFYDVNGGCTHPDADYGKYNFSYVTNSTAEKTFKAPDGSAYMEIRFDNDAPGTTAVFSDIMIYPAEVKAENEFDTWTARPHRQLYAYGASVGTLQTPVRPGYKFDKWMEDTDGDGIGDAAAPTGTITSSRVLYSTWTVDNFTLTFDANGGNASATSLVYSPEGSVQMPTVTRDGYAFDGWKVTTAGGNWNAGDTYEASQVLTGKTGNATLTAQWVNEWTVTYYYGDNTTVLATVKVKDGETVGTLPTVTPTKETTDEYEYKFDHWYANSAEFKADTVITSDLRVYPVFNNIAHNFVWADYYEVEATCTEAAIVNRYCADCYYDLGDFTYTGDNKEWLALGHEFDENDILRNSDQGDGNHLIKCVRYSDCNTTKTAEHIWSGNSSEGATCVLPGKIKQICPCGATQTIDGELDKTNHVNTKLVNVVTPDCENDGYTGDVVCDDCGVTISFGETDPKLGHSFTKYLSDGNATCTADGTETAQCDRCDAKDTRTVEGSKLDHTFTNYVYNNDAKCGVDGTKTAECDTCDTGATHTITAEGTALEHKFEGEIKNNNDGTHSYKCTNEGCEVYGGTTDCTYGEWDTTGVDNHVKTCSACGYKLIGEHSFSAWVSTDLYKEADGQHSKECSVCKKVVTEDCIYTEKSFAETCTTDGFTVHTCNECKHEYTTADKGKTGHNYTGAVKSYDNGYHNFLCKNGCNTYGFDGITNARTTCTYKYNNNKAGEHQATCTACNYTFAEECSGGQASCTTLKKCQHCNTEYGTTDPHSFTGTVVKLDGDKHAYLCEYCSTAGLYGVGAEKDATENCSGGTATCKDLAVCEKCNDTYGDYAAHIFDGEAVKLDGDVHAYRCSVCKNNALYGVGNEDNKTEACSGGKATCTDLAVCTVCNDTHGELDKDAHKWGAWANVEGSETHKRICEYNNAHTETEDCFSPDIVVIAPDCETPGYTLNTCEICTHEWHTAPTEALGHDWSAWVNNEDGTHTRTCQDETCKYGKDGGAKVETADCTKENAEAVVTEPTCTEGGYTTYTCKDCGYVWTDDATSATGHSYTEKTKKTDSKYLRSTKDCVTDWTYWYCCDNCDVSAETEKDKYDNEADLYWVREAAAGHKYDAKTATEDYLATKATCTEKATYYYSCSVCKASSKGTESEKTFEHGSALGHDWQDTETYLKSEADCVNNEVYYKECSRCHISSQGATDATWEKADTKSGHDFEDGYTKGVAATCTEPGVVEHYTCNVCNKHFKADKTTEIAADKLTIAALKHDYKDVAAKPATCEEAGYTKHKQCQREGCGYRNTDYKVIDALGHEFKAENGYYTDTAIGYHAYKCSNCEAYGVDKVKYSAEYDGLDWIVVGGIKCEFTGEYVNYEDANGIHSHKLNCVCGNEQSATCADAAPERVAPTCTEDGYYIHVCDVCSFEWIVESDAEEDQALGHDTQVVPNNNGTHSIKCQREGCDYEEAAEKCSTATPATNCGDYDICDICKTAFGEAKPHVFTNYVYNNDAKCGVNGTETATCDTCKGETKATDTRTAEGTALQHVMVVFEDADSLEYKTAGVWQYNNAYGYDLSKWNGKPADFDDASIYRPTCSEDGLAISYCTREGCDHYITMVAARVDDGHEWGEEKSIGGNCATGVTFRKECVNCGAATTRVETVDHTYVLRALEAATCVSEEIRYYVCSVCGDENEEHIGEKLGHDWATDVIEKEATCGQTGRKYSICSRCNAASEKTEIPRTGHVWEQEGFDYAEYLEEYPNANILYVEAVEATCEFEGHNGYYKCFSCSYDQHLDEEWRKDNIIAKKGHEDNNGDSKCDECNYKIYGEDKDSACGCICHKENWFSKLIYKILRFFWKLFGIGKSCACGTVHY